jgi:hypothetical protein
MLVNVTPICSAAAMIAVTAMSVAMTTIDISP